MILERYSYHQNACSRRIPHSESRKEKNRGCVSCTSNNFSFSWVAVHFFELLGVSYKDLLQFWGFFRLFILITTPWSLKGSENGILSLLLSSRNVDRFFQLHVFFYTSLCFSKSMQEGVCDLVQLVRGTSTHSYGNKNQFKEKIFQYKDRTLTCNINRLFLELSVKQRLRSECPG